MRLDKFIAESTKLTRSQAKKAIGQGRITVNGEVQKNSAEKVLDSDNICYNQDEISLRKTRYIMLNKPTGAVCSTVTDNHASVLEYIDLEKKGNLRIVGRLDQDTTGLVLITDDGQWSHKITSPKMKCGKSYLVELAEPISEEAISLCDQGLLLKGEEKPTYPAELVIISEKSVKLTIYEGRYHQVKRMFAAMGNNVVSLHRESIGNIILDPGLAPGEWRYLTSEEL